MAENDQDNGNGQEERDVRATRILTDIAPRAWEHPADRAALAALRKVPVFDDVLRKLFGFFGEKPIRLAFLASSVRLDMRSRRPSGPQSAVRFCTCAGAKKNAGSGPG